MSVTRDREGSVESMIVYCLSLVGIYIVVHDLLEVQDKPEYFLVYPNVSNLVTILDIPSQLQQ